MRRKATKDLEVVEQVPTVQEQVSTVVVESEPAVSDKQDEPKNVECVTAREKKYFETKCIRLYPTSVSKNPLKAIHGKFFFWDAMEVVTGRIRITDSPSGIGKVDRILGWVDEQEVLKWMN